MTRTRWFVASVAALATVLALGCTGNSPIGILRFVGRITGTVPGPGGPPTTQPGGGEDPNGVCSLNDDQRSLRILIRNESLLPARFALGLFATAGSGGFVCAEELENYTDFGYQAANVVTGGTFNYGCASLTLSNGTTLFVSRNTGDVRARPPNEPFVTADRPFDGNTDIPLPQFIVLGEESRSSVFSCQFNDPCTQGGFNYGNGVLATALRTQGTLCNEQLFSQPLWSLASLTQPDRSARAFEYVKAGIITITILDRATASNPTQNRVVWEVRDANDVIIHREER